MKNVAMAIAAHPDDIEFLMAGTLLLLKKAGYEIHYMNLSTGNCGSTVYNGAETTRIRKEEAKQAAEILGATFHEPICDDFEIMYEVALLKKVSAIIRKVKPNIILTHAPSDYMEDHMNTSRLATTAAFVRGVKNYDCGEAATSNYNCAIYHALPHGLMDPLRKRVHPEMYVNTASVHAVKRQALEAHRSQQEWLNDSQKMNSYILAMEDFSMEVGGMSGAFRHAEGWRRHSHYGFSDEGYNPLQTLNDLVLLNDSYVTA